MVAIRHRLNDFLRAYGGHTGYGVRPQGYAGEMLDLALDYCAKRGMPRVMPACNRENTASRRTILRGGGVLDREFMHTDGHMVQIYWIELSARKTRTGGGLGYGE